MYPLLRYVTSLCFGIGAIHIRDKVEGSVIKRLNGALASRAGKSCGLVVVRKITKAPR